MAGAATARPDRAGDPAHGGRARHRAAGPATAPRRPGRRRLHQRQHRPAQDGRPALRHPRTPRPPAGLRPRPPGPGDPAVGHTGQPHNGTHGRRRAVRRRHDRPARRVRRRRDPDGHRRTGRHRRLLGGATPVPPARPPAGHLVRPVLAAPHHLQRHPGRTRAGPAGGAGLRRRPHPGVRHHGSGRHQQPHPARPPRTRTAGLGGPALPLGARGDPDTRLGHPAGPRPDRRDLDQLAHRVRRIPRRRGPDPGDLPGRLAAHRRPRALGPLRLPPARRPGRRRHQARRPQARPGRHRGGAAPAPAGAPGRGVRRTRRGPGGTGPRRRRTPLRRRPHLLRPARLRRRDAHPGTRPGRRLGLARTPPHPVGQARPGQIAGGHRTGAGPLEGVGAARRAARHRSARPRRLRRTRRPPGHRPAYATDPRNRKGIP